MRGKGEEEEVDEEGALGLGYIFRVLFEVRGSSGNTLNVAIL